jgi:hypothetical protein
MKQDFEMRMIGELTYFLGLQVKQTLEEIFISQSKYATDLVKRFGLDGKSHARTPMGTSVKINVLILQAKKFFSTLQPVDQMLPSMCLISSKS